MSRKSVFEFLGIYNKGYKVVKTKEIEFESFLESLKSFYSKTSKFSDENEEVLKSCFKETVLRDYDCYLGEKKIDLSIKKDGKLEVFFEFKHPKNVKEMLQIDSDNINRKSLQESIWYYHKLEKEERYNIKNVVITDTDQFFFFDPKGFNHPKLVKICSQFQNKKYSIDTTKDLYPLIQEVIEKEGIDFDYCCFNLKKYKNAILEDKLSSKDIKQLEHFFKLLRRDFLFREFNPKDSNELNESFYKELLYILGLVETKSAKKTVIKLTDDPNTFSYQIRNQFDTNEDTTVKLLTVWMNRILFLKLFEGQLLTFNRGDRKYAFLSYEKISSFSKLNNLFFNILGKSFKERDSNANNHIPYLNSALFEVHPLEKEYGRISNLLSDDDSLVPLYKGSVLKKVSKAKSLNLLQYLLDFSLY